MILQNDTTTTINTGSGGGTVSFGALLEAGAGNNDSLVIASGTGDVTFTGNIGTSNELGGLDVNAATAGTGDITFTGNIGVSGGQSGVFGTTAIGGTTTENVHFNSTYYGFDGGTTTIVATNDSGLGDDENIELGANSTVTFKAAGEALSFNTSKIDLSNGADLSIDSTGGAITIAGICLLYTSPSPRD